MLQTLILSQTPLHTPLLEHLPKQLHTDTVTTFEDAEAFLATQSVELLIICAPSHTPELVSFLSYLADLYFPMKVLVLLQRLSAESVPVLLEAGADECLGQQCLPALFKIKCRQLISLQKLKSHDVLTAGSITLAPQSGELWLGSAKTTLRRRETQILECLLRYKNRVVSRDMILSHVWTGECEIPADVTIDVYIRRLRMVLREHQAMLATVRGFGYKLSESPMA